MTRSESIKNLSKALLGAQLEMQNAKKDAKNPHFGNNYATIEAILEAAKPVLNKHGVVVMQGGEKVEGDVRSLNLTTYLVHADSGEHVSFTSSVPLVKADPQAFGSGMTYARRYSLAAICGLAQEDDDGNDASGRNERSSKQTASYSKPTSSPPSAKKPTNTTTATKDYAKPTMINGVRTYTEIDGLENPLKEEEFDWRVVVCHVSKKHNGAILGDIPPADVNWFESNWTPKIWTDKKGVKHAPSEDDWTLDAALVLRSRESNQNNNDNPFK